MMTCFHASSPWARADDAARTHALNLAALLDVSTMRRSHMTTNIAFDLGRWWHMLN